MPFHNPINYADGLLTELEGAERAARTETIADIREQLPELAKAVDAVDAKSLDDDGAAFLAATRARLAAVLEPRKAPRTTAAASAPNKAVPPAAK
jgi:hypothetical protein